MRRVSVPFKLSAVMVLAACTLLVALGLVCSSAYGNVQSDDETAGSTPLMAASVDDFTLMAASSKSAVYNVGAGSCTCDDPDTDYTIVGTSKNGATVTIKGGDSEARAVHVTLDNVIIDQGPVKPSSAPITVESGYAVVKLRGTNVLRAGYKDESFAHDWGFAGLSVPSGATCIITSADGDGSTNGSLEAHGGHNKYGGAGIGTDYNVSTGSIYINGGTIRAYGAHCAAGIGSGRDGQCYTMCIQGGDVWAWGGEYAAGIGGGDAVGTGKGGTTHDLWVHGGTVHAYGGDNGGAGIGGSEGGSTDSITITGGNITAYGCGENGSKGSAAGIGSGDGEECGTIKIDQGSGALTIDAKGYGEGAGIGGANCDSGTINIKLRGGVITATGGPEAAGIGGGGKPSGTINIKGNGTINAHAGAESAAIGAGNQKHSGPININGNSSRLNINAYAPKPAKAGENFVSHAAIIGAGDGSASDISINNANINLNGSSGATIEGAGIGTGSSNDLSMSDDGINNIAISNATIRFYSIYKMDAAGIGAGYGSTIRKAITLNNVDYEGPTIGSSCSDRYLVNENSMESISISNSKIKAIARGDSKYNHAGIGTGSYGTINSITIDNSDVEAKGVNGGAGIGSGGMYVNPSQVLHLASDDGKCGSVTITGRSKVIATGSQGGAGVGSGTLTSVEGTISITGGATVEAVGGDDGGAGIGGGKLCSCKDIVIDGSTVKAMGGPAAAGIGSGGVDDTTFISGVIQTAWNSTCGNVTISGKSNVKATGGAGAAGIGLGQGAQMESGSWITISGGTVEATGGLRGAGIGAGRQSGWNRGAEARRIKIEGEAKVTATGGAGAAGIGGGYEGGLEKCQIGLSVNDPDRAFVIARGGLGAAGIGAGASSKSANSSKGTMDGAHDAKSLSFSGGFIAAYGGDGKDVDGEGRTGAGAGIGGGSLQGDLEGCTISGGVVVAHAGKKMSGVNGEVPAQDIGHGGSRDGSGGDGSDSIYLTGGTVIGEVNENENVIVCGGSVTHGFTPGKAVDAHYNNIPVYQNALNVETVGRPYKFDNLKFYNVSPVSTSAEYYNGDSVFAIVEDGLPDKRARVYLYLPEGTQNSTLAFVKPVDATLSYYGTTAAIQHPDFENNTNVLKMGAPIAIAPKRRSADLIEGEPYIVRVADLDGGLGDKDTACYISAENATYKGYRMADDTMNSDVSKVPIYTNYVSSGRTYTDVTVIPGAAGETMKLIAKLNGASTASDLYWGNGVAVFEKEIVTAPPSVEITNADQLSKVYDGDPAIDPIIATKPEGCEVKRIRCLGQWGTDYDKTVIPPDDHDYMPSAIGCYEVTVWADFNGQTVTDSASFKIVDPQAPKQPTSLTVADPSKTYDTQPVSPSVQCTSDGQVTLSYKKQDDTALTGAPKDVGDYIVSASVPMTVTYEAASAESRFSITPKEGSLTLAAIGDGKTEKATVTAHLSGVYDDVIGQNVTFTLDNGTKTASAQLSSEEDGTFTATCTFDGVKPGHHLAIADYSNPNYHVDDATAAFVVDAPLPAVSVTITENPTKFYDGVAVKNPAVQVLKEGVDATSRAKVTYSYQPGSINPSETGVYFVTATATVDGASASDTRPFLIRKCPVELSIEALDKTYDGQPVSPVVTAKAENGLEIEPNAALTYYKEQSNGTYGGASTDPPVEPGNYYVKAERPGDNHYRAAEADAKFSIVDKQVPFLFVDMPERFVYDAESVDSPTVWAFGEGVEIAYYDAAGNELDGEPTNAGSYFVEVSMRGADEHQVVSSGMIPFTILPRPAVLDISVVGNQATEGAEVAVTLKGALSDVVGKFVDIDVAYDEPDTMSAQSVGDISLVAQASASVQAQIKNVDGSFVATHEFSHVGAGEYMVTASYSGDSNYIVKDKEERFDKSMRAYRVSAEDKTVTFGDASFAVKAAVRDSNGAEVVNPKLSYSQVSSEDLPMVDEDSAVLGEDGMVSVRNAGMSAIRVDVAGDDTHDGDYDYAVITVEKAPLALTVTAKDKVADGKPAEVAYSVDDAAYPKPYSGAVELTYFRESAGVRTQLNAAPAESGSYVVVATAAGDRNYNAAVDEAGFKIQATSDSDNPNNPDTKPAPGNDSGGKNGGTSASGRPQTGDNTVIWPLVVLAAFGFVTLAYSACRMRAGKRQDDDEGQTG